MLGLNDHKEYYMITRNIFIEWDEMEQNFMIETLYCQCKTGGKERDVVNMLEREGRRINTQTGIYSPCQSLSE